MNKLLAFIRLGRPLFLGGGFLLFGLGALIAAVHGHVIDVRRYALGQGVVTAFQLMTHYANDYFDYEADRANLTPTRWSGGSRVLVEGELPRSVALIAALVLAALGIALSAVLVCDAGASIVPTLAAMAVLAWTYSAPPVRLCARGLGEVATAIVVTGLVPWLAFSLQAPDLRGGSTVLLAVAPLAVLQIAMLVAIEFPDAAGDAATGKRTLVVRLGAERAAQLYVLLMTLAYLCLPIASLLGLSTRVVIAATVPAPLAAWRISRIGDHGDPQAHQRLTFFAVFLLIGTSIAELIAFATLL
ncbi:MAG: prenyltransferase [Deltaproteobacteria bacterium]|nr:prenyltransferase [Deltaproteobacteria bacterium]